MNSIKFNSNELTNYVNGIVSFDVPITVSKENTVSFTLVVENDKFLYSTESKRDSDFDKLKSIVPHLSFIEL